MLAASDDANDADDERAPKLIREPPALLTDEELDKLHALAHALYSIAGNNQPHLRNNLSNEIDRLRKLIADDGSREAIAELAEELNSETLMDWAEALSDGQQVLDKLTIKLANETAEGFDHDE